MRTLFLTLINLTVFFNLQAQDVAMLDASSNINLSNNNHYFKISNSDYFFSVNNFNLPEVVKELQQEVAKYDIKTKDVYDNSEPGIYDVQLKKGKHNISLTFDNNGEIISSKEVYKNIALPQYLRVKLAKRFPKWAIVKTRLTVNYFYNKNLQVLYIVKLQNEKKNKTIYINDVGEFI